MFYTRYHTQMKGLRMHVTSVGFKTQPLSSNKIHKKPFENRVFSPKSLSNDCVTISNKTKPSFGKDFKPEDILKLIKEENLLGVGKTNKAYSLDHLPHFVLRVPNNLNPNEAIKLNCAPVEAFCKEYNFGEPIIDFGKGILLLNKVEGIGCSFKNWINHMKATVFRHMPISKTDAKENLKNLKAISELPIEAYIDLAKKIKHLNTTTKTVDCINPNNIIVDFNNKKFNIIDLWEKGTHKTEGKAGFDHMVTLLCDGILHMDTLKALPASKAVEYENITNTIIYKCQTAAQLTNLPRTKRIILNTFQNVETMIKSMLNINIDYTNRYIAFCKKYGI